MSVDNQTQKKWVVAMNIAFDTGLVSIKLERKPGP